jgi:hypothetical protein
MIRSAYGFAPRKLDRVHTAPPVVLAHDGVYRSHMDGGPASGATIVRAMPEQGGVVVARIWMIPGTHSWTRRGWGWRGGATAA